MIHWMRSRLGNEQGFTLVELMVVVLIIAILVAIAIPTFLGARSSAQDRAAQSNLRNALTAAKVFYVDNEDYDTTAALLMAIEPSLTLVDGNAPDRTANPVEDAGVLPLASTDGDANQAIIFVAESASGDWFCIADETSGSGAGTSYGTASGAAVTGANLDTLLECAAAGW